MSSEREEKRNGYNPKMFESTPNQNPIPKPVQKHASDGFLANYFRPKEEKTGRQDMITCYRKLYMPQ